jgi:hypothetical protein
MSLIGILMIAGFVYMTCDLIAMANEKHKNRGE